MLNVYYIFSFNLKTALAVVHYPHFTDEEKDATANHSGTQGFFESKPALKLY